MYGISSFSNIALGALSWRSEQPAYNRQSTTSDRACLKTMLTFPFALLWTLLVRFFWRLFSCLPKRIQRPIRFSGWYAGKWGHHQKSSAKIKLGQISVHRSRGLLKKEAEKVLVNALLYDIVVLIAPKVHYVDLVNLSMVSKRVRATMFPTTKEKGQNRHLRLYSCCGNRKSECWICGIQICNVSSHEFLVGL
jgi:hypothetical protein